jgi:hypothetical protein
MENWPKGLITKAKNEEKFFIDSVCTSVQKSTFVWS